MNELGHQSRYARLPCSLRLYLASCPTHANASQNSFAVARTIQHARSDVSLPPAREKHLDHEHLQPRHRNHQPTLQQRKIEDPLLRAPDRADVPVLPRAEVFLLPRDGGNLARKLENGLFDAAELVGRGTGFGGEGGALGFIFDLCDEVSQLLFPLPAFLLFSLPTSKCAYR